MARRPTPHPTDAEMQILKFLWESGPAALGEICEAVQNNRPVAKTTVATTLGVMLNKGLVKRERGGRVYLWSAVINAQKTARKVARRLLDQVFDGSARQLVAHLIDSGDLTERDITAIRQLIDDYRNSAEKDASP